MIETAQHVGRGILAVSLNLIAFLASVVTVLICGTYDLLPLPAIMGLAGLCAALHWCAWRTGTNPLKSRLYVRLFFLLAFVCALAAHTAYQLYGTSLFVGWVAFILACALCARLLIRWQARQTNELDAKPDPESWQTATSVIYRHGGYFWPLYIMLAVASLYLVAAIFRYLIPILRQGSFLETVAAAGFVLTLCLTMILGGGKLGVSLLRRFFPDQPYVWANPRGLSVQDCLFVEWRDIKQIDVQWESAPRGGRLYAAGAIIKTDKAREMGRVIVPMASATLNAEEAVDLMREMASKNGCALPDKGPKFTAAMQARYAKLMDRSYRRVHQKPEQRQKLDEAINNLSEHLAKVDTIIADLPARREKMKQQIASAEENIRSTEARLQKLLSCPSPDNQASIEVYKKCLEKFHESRANFQEMINKLPENEEQFQATRDKMAAQLADNIKRKERFCS